MVRPDELSERDRRIVDVIRALRPGEVVTYGDIAEVAGYPGRARLVGRLLSALDVELPWWRVVTSGGRLVPGHETEQAGLLRVEDVSVVGGRVTAAPLGRFRRATGHRGPALRSSSRTRS